MASEVRQHGLDRLRTLRIVAQFPGPHSHLIEWAVKEITRLRAELAALKKEVRRGA